MNVAADWIHFGPSTSANTYTLARAFESWLRPGDAMIVTNQITLIQRVSSTRRYLLATCLVIENIPKPVPGRAIDGSDDQGGTFPSHPAIRHGPPAVTHTAGGALLHRSLFHDFDQLDFEKRKRATLDLGRAALVAVRDLGRAGELGLAADLHQL